VADELEGKARRTTAFAEKGRRVVVLEEKGEGGGPRAGSRGRRWRG
jgi:hypothetical protein